MRNARKRRLKRKHGNHPALPQRRWGTIKPRLEPVVRAARSARRPVALAPKPIALEDL